MHRNLKTPVYRLRFSLILESSEFRCVPFKNVFIFFLRTDISVDENLTDFNRWTNMFVFGFKNLFLSWIYQVLRHQWQPDPTCIKNFTWKPFDLTRIYFFHVFQCYWYNNIAYHYVTGKCEYYVFVNDLLTAWCGSCTYRFHSSQKHVFTLSTIGLCPL